MDLKRAEYVNYRMAVCSAPPVLHQHPSLSAPELDVEGLGVSAVNGTQGATVHSTDRTAPGARSGSVSGCHGNGQ